MKIAKILTGTPDNQKGAFNNVMARTEHLMAVQENVDCYMVRLYHNWLLRLLKGQTKSINKHEYAEVNGIKFKNIWVKIKPIDYLLVERLAKRPFIGKRQLDKYIGLFKGYDLLSVHGLESIYIADEAKREYEIPFVSTWHGSDINITPLKNPSARIRIKQFIENAGHNFFVSGKLMQTSDKVTVSKNKSVLYTAPAETFKQMDDAERLLMRNKYNITTTYVVGFIGNIIPIKNVLSLPGIFSKLQKALNSDVSFVIVGDGGLEQELKQRLAELRINNIIYLGLQRPNNIPDIMNTFDVLVLPSLNEGLPRVTLEAQACGVHVVGSDRGGIPESIGQHNCFALDDNFETYISNRIIEILKNNEPRPTLPEKFSWDEAVRIEMEVHNKLVRNR